LLALVALCAGVAGCRSFDPKHPLNGAPELDASRPGFWIWLSDDVWHVRASSGAQAHRFQGSVTGLNGGVTELAPTRLELKDRVAVVGDAVQFDLGGPGPPPSGAADGFDLRVAGGCARFDLYLDGQRRPERVRMGPRGLRPRHIPFDRCP